MILLKNGLVFNGEEKAFRSDILIEKDKIVKISKNINNENAEIIDCKNKCIAPGFIDAHSHNDFFAAMDDNLKYFETFIKQGVTTMITGNCGFSAAGYKQNTPYNNEIGGGLFTNNGKDWHSFKEWANMVDKKSPINIASLQGHGTVRISLNSMSSSNLNEKQLEELENLIEKTLEEGAAGVSLGLMYEPSQFAPRDELLRIAKIVKKHNKVLSFHIRALSKVSTSYTPPIGGKAHILRALDEVIDITKQTGVKTQISHLIFVGEKTWNCVGEAIDMIEKANNEGLDIMFDIYALTFGASIITVIMPLWYLSLSKEKRQKTLTKLRLALEMAVTKKTLGFSFNDVMVSNTRGILKEIEGKTIAQIAKEWKTSHNKAFLKVIEQTNGKTDVLMFKYSNEEIINRLRKHPLSLFMTDAWITEQGVQNFAAYYNFVKFLIMARENSEPIEDTIKKMTSLTAKRYSIKDRGLIKEGYKADITIFDKEKLDYKEQKELSPDGIDFVIINGKIVLKNGVLDKKAVKGSGKFISV